MEMKANLDGKEFLTLSFDFRKSFLVKAELSH